MQTLRAAFQQSRRMRSIRGAVSELVPNAEDRVEWTSPLLGRFALKNITHIAPSSTGRSRSSSFFELNAALRAEPGMDAHKYTRTIFAGSGMILGVIQCTLGMDMGGADWAGVEADMEFQISHGLITPTPDDYANLTAYLEAGLLDVPR